MKIALVLAEGFEESEALVVADILRRAKLDVLTVSIGKREVTGSHNITVVADALMSEISSDDVRAVVLPGGVPGGRNLCDSEAVVSLVKKVYEKGGIVGAICSAPIVLGKAGVLKGKRATCYPGYEAELTGATFVEERCVIDGHVVTANAAGSVFLFGIKLAEVLKDRATSEDIAKAMFVDLF